MINITYLVHHSEDSRYCDKPLEDCGENKRDVESREHDDGLRNELNQWCNDRDLCHLAESRTRLGERQVVRLASTTCALAKDLSWIGLWHSDSEGVCHKTNHQRYKCVPSEGRCW